MSFPRTAHFTKQGSKPHNEDYSSSETIIPSTPHPSTPPYISVLVVCDGHGLDGEGLDCATFSGTLAISSIKYWVNNPNLDWTTIDWTKEATSLTATLHEEYRQFCITKGGVNAQGKPLRYADADGTVYEGNNAIHSGSTFSLVLVFPWNQGFRTVSIQVGDSDIYLNSAILPCNHSGTNPKEFLRIRDNFPADKRLLLCYQAPHNPEVFQPDGTFHPRYYDSSRPTAPWRWNMRLSPSCARYEPAVYASAPSNFKQYMKLAVTRAIGDFYAHPYGLTTEPQIYITDTATCPSVFVASDGAWDTINSSDLWVDSTGVVLGNVDLSKLVMEKSIQEVVKERVEELYTLYIDLFQMGHELHVDDISIAVLMP
jgi:serine/threonine protein phosphatase PrpC